MNLQNLNKTITRAIVKLTHPFQRRNVKKSNETTRHDSWHRDEHDGRSTFWRSSRTAVIRAYKGY